MTERVFISRLSEQRSSVRYLGICEETEVDFNRRMHMPDSHPGLLINCGAPLTLELDDGKQIELPRVFFGGVQMHYLKVRATGACRYIGLDIHAWGTRFLIDDHIDLATTTIVPLGGVWDDFLQTLDATIDGQSETEALRLLDQFVADLHQRKRFDLTSVRTALDALYATDGQFNLPELAAHCALSPSQLERQFKYYIGVTPKAFARAVRLDAVLNALANAPARQMSYLAQRFGYTDQAHLNHDFKSFMGCTPHDYLAARA